ncbi:acyloxyacyl hydrolase [Cupriavidus sp. LEh25]|nr:acyloxyacyl hydrolase [Cupriavidus sp. LEh25]
MPRQDQEASQDRRAACCDPLPAPTPQTSRPRPPQRRLPRPIPLAVRHAATASLLALPLGLGTAHAAPAVQLGYGFDDTHHVQKVEMAMLWDSGFAWGNPQGWLIDLQWEVNVARWNSSSDNNPHDLWEFGASPVVRIGWWKHAWAPFLELSVGPRLLTGTRTSDDHVISTAFQFSEYAGLGVAFGSDRRFTAGYRFQHLSNSGIKEPNPGTSFHVIYLRYRF